MVSDDVVASFIIAWVGDTAHSERRTLETMWATRLHGELEMRMRMRMRLGLLLRWCVLHVYGAVSVRYRRDVGEARRCGATATGSESFRPGGGKGQGDSDRIWSEITTGRGRRRRTRGQGGDE
jgi:hypothetical protein